MRITSNLQNNQILSSIVTGQTDLATLQQQVNSGQKINAGSDNPSAVSTILNASATLNKIEMYEDNIYYLNAEGNLTDSTLGSVSDAIQRIKTLTIEAANATNNSSSLDAIKSEVEELKKQIVSLANTKYQDNYIFSGNKTSTETYTIADDGSIVYNGTPASGDYKREYSIADGVNISINYPGSSILGYSNLTIAGPPAEYEGEGLFNTLNNLTAQLEAENYDGIRSKIDELEKASNTVINTRTEIGGVQNRLNLTKEQHENNKVTYSALKADLQDIDITQAVSDLSSKEVALQASLYMSSQIMNISLLNYL